jgi:hypothetical protein
MSDQSKYTGSYNPARLMLYPSIFVITFEADAPNVIVQEVQNDLWASEPSAGVTA